MKLEIDRQAEHAVLRIREPYLNFTVGPSLRATIQEITGEGLCNLVLDMSDVNSTDSSGLSAFVAANRICRDKGGALILIHISDQIEKIIGLARLEDVLQTEDNLDDALQSIQHRRDEKPDQTNSSGSMYGGDAQRMQRFHFP